MRPIFLFDVGIVVFAIGPTAGEWNAAQRPAHEVFIEWPTAFRGKGGRLGAAFTDIYPVYYAQTSRLLVISGRDHISSTTRLRVFSSAGEVATSLG